MKHEPLQAQPTPPQGGASRRFLAFGLAGMTGLIGLNGIAQAATVTTTFNVTATVVDACSVSATDLAFGTYDPNAPTARTATSSINVNCSLGTPYTISLNNGANASGSTRRMASGSNRMTYALYRDAASALGFGTLANLLNASGTGTGVAVPTTVYGVIPQSQNLSPGSYADQITVTVEY